VKTDPDLKRAERGCLISIATQVRASGALWPEPGFADGVPPALTGGNKPKTGRESLKDT
jgi:hypothetical protein